MICVYLEPMDVAGLRLLNRNLAAIGLEYLVSQVHLIPKPDSFDKLLAVAEYPVASQFVTALFYEADLLTSSCLFRDDREGWEKRIAGPEFASPLEEVQDPYFESACDLLPRRYFRAISVPKRRHQPGQHHYTKREIQQAFEKYRSYLAEQRRMHESAAYEEALVRAMKRLPRLTSIIMSCSRGNTNHFRAAFEAGLTEFATLDPFLADRVGAPQLTLLLSAAEKAGLQIKKLVCGSLGQNFFSHSLEHRDAMKRSIQNLRRLHLFFSHIPQELDPNAERNPHGSSGRHSTHFATSAPNLEILSISYNEDRTIDPPDLKHIVVQFHWPCLASAIFAKMSTDPDTLIGFCDRHASTLKDLSLTDIALHSGQWDSMFYQMRQRLELKKMSVAGIFQNVEGNNWDFESGDHATKLWIERYIVHSDNAPRNLSLERFAVM